VGFHFLRSILGLQLAAAAVAACGAAPYAPADGAPPDVFTPFDAAASDDGGGGGGTCSSSGASVIRVHLVMPVDAGVPPGQLWLGALCTDAAGEQHSTRVVTVDPSSPDVQLASLGPGQYVVRASAPTFEGDSSSTLTVHASETLDTSLYLRVGPAPLAIVRAALGPDAGVTPGADGGAASLDGSSAGLRTFEGPLTLGDGTTEPVGRVQVVLQPRGTTLFDVSVRVQAIACTAVCPPIWLSGVELRLARNGQPAALALATFDGAPVRLEAFTTVVAPLRTLPGALDDPDLELDVLVYRALGPADDAGVGGDGGSTLSDAGRDG
jgi:hypothetical protein